jgi:hypothetical protein
MADQPSQPALQRLETTSDTFAGPVLVANSSIQVILVFLVFPHDEKSSPIWRLAPIVWC